MNTERHRALLLFGFLLSCFVATSTGRLHVRDEASAFFQARSLVEEGALVVPEETPGFEFYGRRDRAGRPRAPYGPAHAAALVPFYLLGKLLAGAPGVPPEAADLVISFGVVLSSAVFAALCAALFALLLERRNVAPPAAAGAALALAFGTPLLAYSGYLFSEPLAAVLLLGATLAAFGRGGAIAPGRAAIAGGLLGACVLVRGPHLLAAPVFVLAILMRDRGRGVGAAVAVAAPVAGALAGYLLWNDYLFGDPLEFGYPERVEWGKRMHSFETPLTRGLAGFLLSPGKSVFLFAPVSALALAGLPGLSRRDPGLALVAGGVPLAYLLFYARYTQWEGGHCLGPRFLVPAIPLLLLSLGPAFERISRCGRRLAMALVLAGGLVQAIGLATSFLEDQRPGGSYSGPYYDEAFNYRLTYNPLASQGALLVRYLRGEPAPLGKGFDRWFVLLGKGGVAWAPRAALLLLAVGSAAAAGLALRSSLGARR